MYERKINKSAVLISVAVSCFLLTSTAVADDREDDRQKVNTVNCGKPGASVQKAVDRLKKRGREGTIYIDGFCNESVSITHDGITLSGNQSGTGVIGGGLAEITVTGAQRIQIEYLEIAGAGYGVLVQEGSAVAVRHSHIHDNLADGIGAFHSVFVRLESNTIVGNSQIEDGGGGINATAGGFVRSSGNYIAGNGYSAVQIGNNSYFRSSDGDVVIQTGCTEDELPGDGSTCGVVDTIAFDCYRNSVCDVRGTTVVGNNDISGLANLDARNNSSFNGSIIGSGGSRLNIRSSVPVYGTVLCFSEAFASNAVRCDN